MKNQSVMQHRIGFNQVFDQIYQIYLRLPQYFRIYVRSEKAWIGGKEDGAIYLHLERLPANALELDRPLADGDLDIQVYPQGNGDEIEEGIMGQEVKCVLRGEDLAGLWFRVSFNDRHHYLVLLAAREKGQYPELMQVGKQLSRMIRSQSPDSVKRMTGELASVG